MKKCSLCAKRLEKEEPEILTVGSYGVARYLCDDCAALLDKMTLSTEVSDIKEAYDAVVEKMLDGPLIDESANETLQNMLVSAKERAEAIKAGTYDFSLDTPTDEMDEIPEELLESEEDIELDRKRDERAAKLDKVLNIFIIAAIVATAAFVISRFI